MFIQQKQVKYKKIDSGHYEVYHNDMLVGFITKNPLYRTMCWQVEKEAGGRLFSKSGHDRFTFTDAKNIVEETWN